ncbi:MAG: hypothetical protein Q4C29_03105 [bacterium]|nr:hypothetical protein [bacterium]
MIKLIKYVLSYFLIRNLYVSYFFTYFLNKDYEEIYKTIKFVKTELDKEINSEREKRVDFICKLDNEYILLEMNNSMKHSFLRLLVF